MEISKGGLDLKLVTEVSYDNDNIKETILEYSENFTKLEDAVKDSVTSPTLIPIGITYKIGHILWNAVPSMGGYIGWVNTSEGEQLNIWQSKKAYAVGEKIKGTLSNNNAYTCISDGVSVAIPPSFPIGEGTEFSDASGASVWKPNYNYELNDIVIQTDGSKIFYYICETAGYTNSNEPSWALTSIGSTLIDGSTVWRKEKAIIWKQTGKTSVFRPFGKIE